MKNPISIYPGRTVAGGRFYGPADKCAAEVEGIRRMRQCNGRDAVIARVRKYDGSEVDVRLCTRHADAPNVVEIYKVIPKGAIR